MEVGKKFKNIDSYNENMSKHIKDKLFWVDYLPENKDYVIIDFGCADGAMINYLCEINKESKQKNTYIGYDISETMIKIAKTNFHGDSSDDVVFTSSWDNVKNMLNFNKDKVKVLVLSSIIHEVYSYAETENDVDIFWDRVLNTGFDYIMVRDMMVSYDTIRKTASNDYDNLFLNGNSKQLEEFQKIHGNVDIVKNMLHFLLKYRWKINWEREVAEDYFPIFIEDFLEIMKSYNIIYFERFRVQFLDDEIKKDFNIGLTDYTHVKGVFSKKKFSSCQII